MNGMNYSLIVCMYASSIVKLCSRTEYISMGPFKCHVLQCWWRGGIVYRLTQISITKVCSAMLLVLLGVSNVQKKRYATLEWPPSC